jgi:putative ATP-dependent endonuclease of the OLD family
MYISEIQIDGFRLFGTGSDAFVLRLNPGLTALVGENDTGKTAIIDAIRLALGTRDQENLRLDPSDFHQPANGGPRVDQVVIRCVFEGLTPQDRAAFAEYLTYRTKGNAHDMVLYVNWIAKRIEKEGSLRRYTPIECRSGMNGDGPLLEPRARALLTATYLRPLRDAERAMSAGRGSRLSQILQHTKEIKHKGVAYDPVNAPFPDPKTLSVLGLGDYANYLLGETDGIKVTREKLHRNYLAPLSFKDDPLDANISVSQSSDEGTRLRQLLEKLELSLGAPGLADDPITRGLGSNNVLFMACELLLLASEEDGFPLLLIEEPEAHLHPQRQLRLVNFFQDQASKQRDDAQNIQILVTTHSPNLASYIKLDNLVLIRGRRAFPLARGQTHLASADYRFLERFLDVTKANLFFARGVVIVEGDAENILLPTIARLIDRDFLEYGVSVVNVGHTGLRRYANIFLRTNTEQEGEIQIPVACITDMDVMPDCAPSIIGLATTGAEIPTIEQSGRRWRVNQDFTQEALINHRSVLESKASGQRVATFVSNQWTLEYDLAFHGLAEEVWVAAHLSHQDERLHEKKTSVKAELIKARASFAKLREGTSSPEERASYIYHWFAKTGKNVSKPIAAQYLATVLCHQCRKGRFSPQSLRLALPPYLRDAIAHVTAPLVPEVSRATAPKERHG